jgi:hypothetical protein
MLRRKKAAPGRVWLLLRHADAAGRGRVPVAEAARLLTGAGSPLRVCGRRQFDNLLAAGEGLFWTRDPGRDGQPQLRLASAARVAAALGVTRLGGAPVAVPLADLTGTIGRARAHLYASFHSGRGQTDLLTGRRHARAPIARATLRQLSGATANSQRNYERRARVIRQSAIALGLPLNAADEHEVAWRRGRALFRLHDPQGRYGRPGAVYLAWRLPNEYTGPHATLPRGRHKRLNRALADLSCNGMTGNGERNERRVTSDERRVVSGQWSVIRGTTDDGRQTTAAGESNCGQWPVVSSQFLLTTDHRPLPTSRRYYNIAKAAYSARDDGEKYWRCGCLWLTTSYEIRDTKYEFRELVE